MIPLIPCGSTKHLVPLSTASQWAYYSYYPTGNQSIKLKILVDCCHFGNKCVSGLKRPNPLWRIKLQDKLSR